MFHFLNFLKPKTKMAPEDLGMWIAQFQIEKFHLRTSLALNKSVADGPSADKNISAVGKSDLERLWHVILILECVVISVAIEFSRVSEFNKRVVLDVFWNCLPELIAELHSEEKATDYKNNLSEWYPTLRALVIEPSHAYGPGSLGPGKVLYELAMPNRHIYENTDLVIKLTCDFASIYVAATKFAVSCIRQTKFTKSMLRYEQ